MTQAVVTLNSSEKKYMCVEKYEQEETVVFLCMNETPMLIKLSLLLADNSNICVKYSQKSVL